MRIGAFLIAGVLSIGGLVLSLTATARPDVSTLQTTSVRVTSVPPRPIRTRSSGGGGRYSSGGGFSSGK